MPIEGHSRTLAPASHFIVTAPDSSEVKPLLVECVQSLPGWKVEIAMGREVDDPHRLMRVLAETKTILVRQTDREGRELFSWLVSFNRVEHLPLAFKASSESFALDRCVLHGCQYDWAQEACPPAT